MKFDSMMILATMNYGFSCLSTSEVDKHSFMLMAATWVVMAVVGAVYDLLTIARWWKK